MVGANDRGERERPPALAGLRVVELGQLVAGAQCGASLAGYGAEVLKVEGPGGDALRSWRECLDGTSLWWSVLARGKASLELDLKEPAQRELFLDWLVLAQVDVLVENFRPGRLEEWGLGPDQLHARLPKLVIVRISGYGQDGPDASQPGFANVAEARGGLRAITGEVGRPPVRPNLSLGDTLAGLHGALGAMAALRARDCDGAGAGGVVDVSLLESVLATLESVLPEYDALGVVRQPAGSKVPGICPSGTYSCEDGSWIALGANSDSMFRRLARAIGRKAWLDDAALRTNAGRVERQDEIDAAIQDYCSQHSQAHVMAALRDAQIACGPVQDAKAILSDPQLVARSAFDEITLAGGTRVKVLAPVPQFAGRARVTSTAGPALDEGGLALLGLWLGLAPSEVGAARERARGADDARSR